MFCICTFPGEDNVWKEVLTMSDKVKVQYDTIEQLFCQKTVDKTKPVEQTKVKAPTEVRQWVYR